MNTVKVAVIGRGMLTTLQENLIKKFIGEQNFEIEMIPQLTDVNQLKDFDYIVSLINVPAVLQIIKQSGKPYGVFDIQLIQRGIKDKEQAEQVAKEHNADIIFGNEKFGWTVSKTKGLMIEPVIEISEGGEFTTDYILNEIYTEPEDKTIKILFIGFGTLSELQKELLKKLIGIQNIEIDNITKLETNPKLAKEQIKGYKYIVTIPNPIVIDTLNKAKDQNQTVIVFTTKPVLTTELPKETENIDKEIENIKKENNTDIVLVKEIGDKVSVRLLKTDKVLINPTVNISYKDYIPA